MFPTRALLQLVPACFLVPFAVSCAAQYSGPESVEHDPAGDRYFVSNTVSGDILVRDQLGALSSFVTVSPAPYGLEIMGDVLYACSGGSVKGYALSDGEQVFNRNLGGSFLNGITTDGTFLYATDFSSTRIYKVDVVNNTSSILVSNTAGTPNGIVWDPTGGRLVVVFWGNNAPIKSFNAITGAAQTLVANTGLGNVDGITIDCLGNFLVASWSPDRLTRFAPDFASAGVNTGVTGLANPADIDFDLVNNRVCVPNSGANSVTLSDVDCSNRIEERTAYTLHTMPNPTEGLVRFDPPMLTNEPFMVLDARGSLQGSGNLRAQAILDLGDLAPGIYTILFTRLAHQVRVVKE